MNLLFALLLALVPAVQSQPANTVAIGTGAALCQEPSCVITATSVPANFVLGAPTSWCAVAIFQPQLPLVVSWPNTPALCPADPAPNVVKQLLGVQQAQPYDITYTINKVLQPVFTVPALPPPPPPPPPAPTVVSTKTCVGPLTITFYSDGHFEVTASTITCQ